MSLLNRLAHGVATNGSRLLPCLLILVLAAGCVSRPVSREPDLRAWGMAYRLRTFREPRPIRAHILRVDLAAGRVTPAVLIAADPDGDGPADAALTSPFDLIKGRPVVAFVNANSWDGLPDAAGKPDRFWREGQPVEIGGIAVAGGVPRSPAEKSCVSVRFPRTGPPVIEATTNSSDAVEAIAGFQQLVRAGTVLTKPGGTLAPRTAIGINKSGSTLWLAVVDGRQEGFSEGMSFDELAGLMKDLGCHDAANLDGGGSSILGLQGPDGAMRIVNSPSDRFLNSVLIRPLPLVFTLRPVTP